MARFSIRVELHGASHDDYAYTLLHSEMEDVGFLRYLIIKDGDDLALPTGEYNLDDENYEDVGRVLNLAKAAANKTGYKSEILVTKADGSRKWDNLPIWRESKKRSW